MPLNVTQALNNWQFQKSHIERNLDNAAYEAAHPDDTLVCAGPARAADMDPANLGANGGSGGVGNTAAGVADGGPDVPLLPIGMVQQMSWTQQKPTQPLMAIGSGRSFFTSGKATTQWSAARLFVNGRNLLRVLYHNAVHLGVNAESFDDPAAFGANSKFFTNLDSELYYLPFGMACIFRNKAHDWLGAFYAELCMISSWSLSFAAGQNQILENVTGMADRLLPISLSEVSASAGVSRNTVDTIIGFTNSDAASTANGTSPGTNSTSMIGGVA